MLGVLLEGGIDTTSTVFCNVVLACISHPDATRKAQEELDRVVGMTRLPCTDNLPHLHYVRAFINEVLRWRPLVPEGVLRYTSDEDHYRGYHIRKGTIVMFNHWSAHFDEDLYSNAKAFEPERWIENPDLPLQPFGVGRRACPGQHLSRASLSAIIPQMLWAFNIEPGRVDGVPIDIDLSNLTQTGTLLRPSPFKAIFTPRDEHHATLIKRKSVSRDREISAVLDRVGSAVGNLSRKEGMSK
ncbi:hypothetical protein N7517_003635 [Penicillium concentricum]|uniref:Cytochrome P450 n=1 Tax=Penicillium concentricum TaxID=293559 RepID=A0A9W9S6M6_9EURO|nr:uncharacterized protein N7517_003635 [Penicillium concentricum]KAJ5371629.1 hypothetical protein N7517_003635 [Penicillium concentricum]